jgi:pyruvate kinase
LTPVEVPGKPAEREEDEVGYQPAQIGCSLSAVFNDAKPGERVFFDDGKIGGVIRAVQREGVEPQLEVKSLRPPMALPNFVRRRVSTCPIPNSVFQP